MNSKSIFDYVKDFLDDYNFPDEAKESVLSSLDRVINDNDAYTAFVTSIELMMGEETVSPKETYLAIMDKEAQRLGIPNYTLHLALKIAATDHLLKKYREAGIPTVTERETLSDLKDKCLECHMVSGIWGLYNAAWLYKYYKLERFAFGRLQFEITEYNAPDCTVGGISVKCGDKAIGVHIPRNDKPFDSLARLDSYKRAYEFYKSEFEGEKIPFVCGSWLMFPFNSTVLPESSNIVSFSREFKITKVTDESHWLWRIFGVPYNGDPDSMPEDTRLKKAYKARLKEGKTSGSGYGVFLFDGENIIND